MPMAVMMYKWFVLLPVLFTASFIRNGEAPVREAAVHPFYISVFEMEHNEAEKTIEISCKIFADDLETTLKSNYKTIVDLSAEKDKATVDRILPDYIGKHLSLSVDGRPVQLEYIGYEKDKEAAYCYFQVSGVAALKKLDVTNNVLYDLTTDQANIIHVKVKGRRQSSKLDYPAKAASFVF